MKPPAYKHKFDLQDHLIPSEQSKRYTMYPTSDYDTPSTAYKPPFLDIAVELGEYAQFVVYDMGDAIKLAKEHESDQRWSYVQIRRKSTGYREYADPGQILSIEQAEEYIGSNFMVIAGTSIDSFAETEEAATERMDELHNEFPQYADWIRVEAI